MDKVSRSAMSVICVDAGSRLQKYWYLRHNHALLQFTVCLYSSLKLSNIINFIISLLRQRSQLNYHFYLAKFPLKP